MSLVHQISVDTDVLCQGSADAGLQLPLPFLLLELRGTLAD